MTIPEIVEGRKISEILHFTTNGGLVGILASRAVRTRRDLPNDKYVEYVYKPNAMVRRDEAWLGYVNLSISRINVSFHNVSSKKWHKNADLWWCILSFDPALLADQDVWFTTTNNMYSGVKRRPGVEGLESMFGSPIHQWLNNYVPRPADLPDRFPTDMQAEVLYPNALSTDYLRTIYVASEEHYDTAYGQCRSLGYEDVTVKLEPSAFA